MKRPSPNRKEATHDRIVEAASRAIRRSGYAGTSVPDIMKDAGLTHGGFYAHFDSREAMLAEAADRAGADSVATLTRVASSAPPQRALQNMLELYLSREHIAEIVCPVAALGSEMPRQAPEVRRAATGRIKEMIDLVARAHERALVTVSTMIGALLVARAVDDPRLSDAVRAAVLKHLIPTGD
jgi:TetR/AcrR family transcriptional regulator, transcriptional repressor for nem operon